MSFLAPIGAGISMFGGLENAAGTLQAGRAGKAADYYQAAVAANNAQLANEAADRALAAGAAKAEDVSMKSAANVGTIKASQGAAGIDVNTGSALRVQAGARREGQLAAERTEENAQEQAWGYRVRAQSDVAQAQMDVTAGNETEKAAERASTAQTFGAIGGGLLGAAQAVGPNWQSYLPQGFTS